MTFLRHTKNVYNDVELNNYLLRSLADALVSLCMTGVLHILQRLSAAALCPTFFRHNLIRHKSYCTNSRFACAKLHIGFCPHHLNMTQPLYEANTKLIQLLTLPLGIETRAQECTKPLQQRLGTCSTSSWQSLQKWESFFILVSLPSPWFSGTFLPFVRQLLCYLCIRQANVLSWRRWNTKKTVTSFLPFFFRHNKPLQNIQSKIHSWPVFLAPSSGTTTQLYDSKSRWASTSSAGQNTTSERDVKLLSTHLFLKLRPHKPLDWFLHVVLKNLILYAS